MKMQEFNLACAEYMGLLKHGDGETTDDNFVVLTTGSLVIESESYSPHTDANDRNKVIEKMRVKTIFHYPSDTWVCNVCDRLNNKHNYSISMEQAQVQCIEAVLGSETP